MKKLIKNIVIFLIPIVVIIALLPVNKRLMYQGLKDDCFNHGIWIYDRIFNNPKPIDIAFIGSSHTINGINDKLISKESDLGEVVNLGYCRLGRNFSYVLLKELLLKKKPKYLVIEVREDEDRYSHPIFPYIAQSSDVFFANPLFNKDILTDLWTHLTYKIEISQDMFYKHEIPVAIRTDDFGFASSKDTAAISTLEEIKLKRSKPKYSMSKIEHDFYEKFAKVYLNKISELCIENNVKLVFLYLPGYGYSIEEPQEYETYIKLGEVLIPPKSILAGQANWHDENHLNQTGAKELSLWLNEQINIKDLN